MNITTDHIKLEITGTQVKINVDGVDKTPLTLNQSGDIKIGFKINSGHSIKYDNFVIYPI